MAKISPWHFRHLLEVLWLKKACKRGVTGTPGPLATPLFNKRFIYLSIIVCTSILLIYTE